MKTKPLYLEDPYCKTMEAIILDVIAEKEGVFRLILDQTIFYPMGGGQPTDQGLITFSEGKGEVYQVLLKDGEINHYVKTSSLTPKLGEKVSAAVDWERRYKNMRVHAGGHVVDFAMYLLGYSPSPLHPYKGDHGKKPFVVYTGNVPKDIKTQLKDELQKKVNELTAEEMKFSWSFELLEDLEKEAIYLQPGLPKNKPLRALRLEGVGAVADGGTLVASTKEIGKITIMSVENVGTETIIRYQLEG